MKNNRRIAMYFDNNLGYRREIARGVLRYVREHAHIQLLEKSYTPIITWNEMSVEYLAELNPTGIIIPVYNESVQNRIKTLSLPTVSISAAYPQCIFPIVAPDIRKNTSLATQCFLDEGINHLILIGPPMKSAKLRENAAKKTAEPYDVVVDSILLNLKTGDTNERSESFELFHRSFKRYFDNHRKHPGTSFGIIAYNDAYAFAAASSVKRLGLKIPDDVSIIGNDDNDLICEGTAPTLSSVMPDGITQGYTAAKILDLCMQHKKPPERKIYIPATGIHHRESSPLLRTGNPHVDQALRFIRLHACDGISVMDVVEQVALSRRALELHFQSVRGHSPYQEIKKERIKKACWLLEKSDLTNMHIALETGFQSTERFYAAFKSVTGTTPGDYRDQF